MRGVAYLAGSGWWGSGLGAVAAGSGMSGAWASGHPRVRSMAPAGPPDLAEAVVSRGSPVHTVVTVHTG